MFDGPNTHSPGGGDATVDMDAWTTLMETKFQAQLFW